MAPFTACFNPEFNNLLAISDSLFVGVSVRFASWKLGYGDNVCVIRDAPLDYHGIMITLIIHLAPLLTF